MGNYESVRIAVSDCNSWDECDIELRNHLSKHEIEIDKPIELALKKQE